MYLKNVINVEKKFIDVSSGGTTLPTNTTGTIVLLSGCAQGTDINQRVGDSIKYMSLMLEGFVTLNATSQDLVKVSVVMDMQGNAGTPAYSDIYELGNASASLAQRNKTTVDRFRVLKEWNLDLDTAGLTIKKFKCFLKFPMGKDSHEKFNGTGATSASVYSNGIYLVFGGNLTATFSSINYYSRIRYVDN